MTKELSSARLAVMLAALAALTPFSIDTYLPAMPAMAVFFQVEMGLIGATVSTFLFGLAVGQLIGGLLSDRYGRRPVCLTGLVIFMLSSLAIALAQDIGQVLALRFSQAMGGGFVSVIGAAVVRDRYQGKEAARMFALIGLVVMLAPLVAPAIGALLLNFSQWQVLFLFLALYAAIMWVLAFTKLPERRGVRSGHLNLANSLQGYALVFKNRNAVLYMVANMFSAGVLFTYLAEVSFIYIEYLGISPNLFPLFFGANVLTAIVLNRLVPPLLKRHTPHRIFGGGLLLQFGAVALFLLVVLLEQTKLYTVVPALMLAIGCIGLTGPTITACFMDYFPHNSGVANSIFGTLVYVVGGVLGVVATWFHDGTLLPIAVVMTLAVLVSLSAYKAVDVGIAVEKLA